MLEIKKARDTFRIISEPGDCTRYDYLVCIDEPYAYTMGINSTFPFPNKVRIDVAKDVTTIDSANNYLQTMDPDERVNPWTILEVCKTITEIVNNHI